MKSIRLSKVREIEWRVTSMTTVKAARKMRSYRGSRRSWRKLGENKKEQLSKEKKELKKKTEKQKH